MSKFATLSELNEAFLDGSFKFDPRIEISGRTYTLFEVNQVKITETLINYKLPMVVYVSEASQTLLIAAWTTNARNGVLPAGVVEVNGLDLITRVTEHLIVEMDGEKITIRPDQLVGDVVRVSFTGLNNPKELQGKIDTGATVSSLHADNYEIKGTSISFTCSQLSNNTITMPLKTQHAVKSPDGGTVYRPVIELDVKVNGKLIKGAMFNLNDRSHMDQAVLIGQNILQAGKFYVDPSRKESVEGVDWEGLQCLAEIAPIVNRNPNDPILTEFYKRMLDSDVTFKDLVQHIRREVIKTFEDIE
jgi:hypothetical protein